MRNLSNGLEVLGQALNYLAEGVTIADASLPDLTLVFVNEGFTRMTGYTADEIMGRNCRFLQGAETEATAVAEIRQAIQQQKACVVELRNYHKNNTPFWNRLSLTPIFSADQQLIYYVGIQSDITPERDAAQSRQQVRAMQATILTVNDIVLNFMNVLLGLRHQLEHDLHVSPDFLAEFDASFDKTAVALQELANLSEYREHVLGEDIVVLDTTMKES